MKYRFIGYHFSLFDTNKLWPFLLCVGISCENFGCSSKKCFRLPSGPKCECLGGYYLGPDNKTCLDENECDMDMCAQNCTNTPGSFTCSCFSPEHKLRSDHMSCKATGNWSKLFWMTYSFKVRKNWEKGDPCRKVLRFSWKTTLVFAFCVLTFTDVDCYWPKNYFILHLRTILVAESNF